MHNMSMPMPQLAMPACPMAQVSWRAANPSASLHAPNTPCPSMPRCHRSSPLPPATSWRSRRRKSTRGGCSTAVLLLHAAVQCGCWDGMATHCTFAHLLRLLTSAHPPSAVCVLLLTKRARLPLPTQSAVWCWSGTAATAPPFCTRILNPLNLSVPLIIPLQRGAGVGPALHHRAGCCTLQQL